MEKETVFFIFSELKAKTAKHMLDEAGITSFIINKKDSAYAGVFGDIELHIDKADEQRAKEILEDAEIL